LGKGQALYVSAFASLTALFVLGVISAKLVGNSPVRKGIEMLILGGVAIAVGVVVGNIANEIIM